MVKRTHKYLILIFLILFYGTSYGQENKYLTDTQQISIVVADDADIQTVDDDKKAVFLIGNTYDYLGLLIKIENSSENPLVRISKKSDRLEFFKLQRYSQDKYFYYGEPGEYIVEFIDLIDGEWINELLEAKIVGKSGIIDSPQIPNKDVDDLSEIRTRTYEIISGASNKDLFMKLYKEYLSAYESSIGKGNEELRKLMNESRRKVLLAEREIKYPINDFFATIDELIINAGEDKYRSAVEHFISGMNKALSN
jgi:hypothetical protein